VNEVQAMARAGQTVGAVLGTAVLTARKASVGLSRTGAAASRRIARRVTRRKSRVERLQESIVGSAQRAQAAILDSAHRAQESLAETAHRAQESLIDTRQSLAETVVGSVNKARHELATRNEPEPARRRRLLWLLAVGAVLGGLAAYVLSRRPQEEAVFAVEPVVEPEPPRVTPATISDPSGNGVAPQAAGEQGDTESEDAKSSAPSDGSSR
jgi:hypothetical protein